MSFAYRQGTGTKIIKLKRGSYARQSPISGRDRSAGLYVDNVSDVITRTPEQIKPAPAMGVALNTDYLIGLGAIDERMLILVDIERLMSSSEIGLLEKLAA
jgi:chemotaxis signal transduction protein